MAKAKIDAGICGENAVVEATLIENYRVALHIESSCPHILKIGDELKEVDALNEISSRRGKNVPAAIDAGLRLCAHTACPVPSGIIKAVEVAAGLALPKNVTIEIEP